MSSVPFECKENCMKSSQNNNNYAIDISNAKNITDQIKSNITEKKTCKQMISQNRQLTDYFPVRRSSRKTVSIAKKERQNIVEDAILSGKEEGFEIKEFPGKGRGVITKKSIKRGEFVLEYYGELIDYEEAKKREAVYATKDNTGCYMYYFKFKNKQFCVDATKETNRLGRLVNHSKKGNLKTQPFFIKECPHLVLLAGRDIEPGEELSYDYGDRRKDAVESHPWLAL